MLPGSDLLDFQHYLVLQKVKSFSPCCIWLNSDLWCHYILSKAVTISLSYFDSYRSKLCKLQMGFLEPAPTRFLMLSIFYESNLSALLEIILRRSSGRTLRIFIWMSPLECCKCMLHLFAKYSQLMFFIHFSYNISSRKINQNYLFYGSMKATQSTAL